MKIQNKILVMVSAICLFSLSGLSLTTYFTVKNLIGYSRQVNAALGDDAARGAGESLIAQAHHFLRAVTNAQSQNCNNTLDSIKFNILLIEGVVQDIYNNQEIYARERPISKPSENTDGTYRSVYALPKGVQITPEIQEELKLLSNLSMLTSTLSSNPAITQFYVGMESGLFYNYTNLSFEEFEYDCRTRPWYIDALKHPGDVIFTDVYEDAFGMGMVITAAKAIYDENGRLLGVAGLDILLSDLKRLIDSTHITDSGYAFILNSKGMYIIHPNMGMDGFNPFLPKERVEAGADLADGYIGMMSGDEGFVEGIVNEKKAFVAFSPISVADWSIGIVVYEDELLSSLDTLTDQMSILKAKSEKNITEMFGRAITVFIVIFLIVIIMVAALSFVLSRVVSEPIRNLTREVIKIGGGDFKYRIPVKAYDEIGFLTEAFNNMADSSYKYAQNIISLNDTKSKLEVAANTDTLTGIFNRRHFMELAEIENEIALKAGISAFVIIFDLDRFKLVNDTYGHPAGDKALKEITEIVKSSIRSRDLFARYGGEEFIMYISGVSKTVVWYLIERIRQNIYKHPIRVNDMDLFVSASFGISAASPENNLEKAILCADESLYEAKKAGRNKAVLYE